MAPKSAITRISNPTMAPLVVLPRRVPWVFPKNKYYYNYNKNIKKNNNIDNEEKEEHINIKNKDIKIKKKINSKIEK
jgi:hypothetical protein